jgi:hypothetical protein
MRSCTKALVCNPGGNTAEPAVEGDNSIEGNAMASMGNRAAPLSGDRSGTANAALDLPGYGHKVGDRAANAASPTESREAR